MPHDAEYYRRYRKKLSESDRERILKKRREKYGRKATNWSIIMNYVREELADFTASGIKPTLRAMHYRLYSKHSREEKRYAQYHNTKNHYNQLSKSCTAARERTNKNNFYGELPINCFADNTREAIYPNNTELDYEEPKDYADRLIDQLKDLPDKFESLLLPRWLKQPNYIEVWTEKKTMIPTLQSIIGDRDVAIVPLGGHPSVSFLWDNATILKAYRNIGYENKDKNGNIQTSNKKIHIIYLGDLDPSGENIEHVCKKKLKQYGIYDIEFQRLGVTKQQVDDLGLPEDPDPETLDKLEDDNNKDTFIAKYGKLMQIEIDALVAYDAEGLRTMVQKAIDEKFDDEIHQQMLKEYSPESIREDIKDILRIKFGDICG